MQVFTRDGWIWVSPYVTLVSAYERLIRARGREVGPEIAITTQPVAHALPGTSDLQAGPARRIEYGEGIDDLLVPMSSRQEARCRTRLRLEPGRTGLMSVGLIGLLDDIAAIAKVAAASLDDVAGQAAKAGAKAAGVVIDDTAVTPNYVIGFASRANCQSSERSRSDLCETNC